MTLPVKIASCIGVLESMKSQTPSTKLQTNLKFQYQMTKTGFEFWLLLFVCYLEFLVTSADSRTKGKEH